MISMDLSTDFDVVNHSNLIKRLQELPANTKMGHSNSGSCFEFMTEANVKIQDQVLVSKDNYTPRWVKAQDISCVTGWKIERYEKVVFFTQSKQG